MLKMLYKLNDLWKKSSFMRWILKRRRLIAIGIGFCIGFLVYQLLSLKALNVQMSDKTSLGPKAQDNNHMSYDISANDHIIKANLNYNNKQFIYNINTSNNNSNHELNQIEENSNINTDNQSEQKRVNKLIITGVLPKFETLYQKTSDSFRCLLSGETIPYHYLNDDYCDCVDGTDEPSTNACPFNKFYCITNSGNSEEYISSAKVNDGICDCCDGSDEYKGLSTPLKLTSSQIETIKSSRRLVPTPPCPNWCHK